MPPPVLVDLDAIGPEDVVVDPDGQPITGVEDGRILRLTDEGQRIEQLADTGGRPDGIELMADGGLLVCDARLGLLRIDPVSGQVRTLVAAGTPTAGKPLRVCNNAAVAKDGTIYFSDSSQRFDIDHWMADLFEHTGTGRLLRRDPDGEVTELLSGLQFANGVALAADESFVVVAETGAYQLRRVWLNGDRAGEDEVFVSNLPGVPDNLSTGADGRIWIALPSVRNPVLDWLGSRHPMLRKILWRLPMALLMTLERRTMWALAVDSSGAFVCDLQRRGDEHHMVTGVREHAGKLYMTGLLGRTIAVVDLPPVAVG
ncbi:MAG: SMP-30/gluconolactonase/LRE family protein [Kutzneria sp.]|nr:SMP-30/gluconolactonase/LRE family protein [Kutzneria sp.]